MINASGEASNSFARPNETAIAWQDTAFNSQIDTSGNNKWDWWTGHWDY